MEPEQPINVHGQYHAVYVADTNDLPHTDINLDVKKVTDSTYQAQMAFYHYYKDNLLFSEVTNTCEPVINKDTILLNFVMSEEKNTPPKAPGARDKNGRFSKKEAPKPNAADSDQTVKIKDATKQKPSAKDSSSEDGNTVTIRILRHDCDWPRAFGSWTENRTKYIFPDEPKEPKEHFKRIDEDCVEVDGKKYYTEEFTARLLAKTIDTCAQVAAEDIEKLQKGTPNPSKEPEPTTTQPPKEDKKAEDRKIAETLSKIAAHVILGVFCIGLGAAAVFGILQLLQLFFR